MKSSQPVFDFGDEQAPVEASQCGVEGEPVQGRQGAAPRVPAIRGSAIPEAEQSLGGASCSATEGAADSVYAAALLPEEWQEVPQEVFLSWSTAMRLRYCWRRDLHAMLHAENESDTVFAFFSQRAALYEADLKTCHD